MVLIIIPPPPPSFYADFGPLNLAMLYRFCVKVNKKLKVGEQIVLINLDRNYVEVQCGCRVCMLMLVGVKFICLQKGGTSE